ncbi:MAG: hypothetical protein ACTS9Y_00585 [Methylophilus sp.]|uniref:hypothetical protein n=1 Tax=Methylophilus sp. TaxID=29541 RepID=UPI003FA02ADF
MNLLTPIYELKRDGKVIKTSIGDFFDRYEVKVPVKNGYDCRHSIVQTNGNWKVVTLDYMARPESESKTFKNHIKVIEHLFALRLADMEEMYIEGYSPNFYENVDDLVSYVFSTFDEFERINIIEQNIQNQELQWLLINAYCKFMPVDTLKLALQAHKQRQMLVDAMNVAENNAATLAHLRVQRIFFSHLRKRLAVSDNQILFDGKVIDIVYPKPNMKASGPLYEAALNAGLAPQSAEDIYNIGYRMLELDHMRGEHATSA